MTKAEWARGLAAPASSPAEQERALIEAGVPELSAHELAWHGWRDPRPRLRREIARLEKRLAGVRRFAEREVA